MEHETHPQMSEATPGSHMSQPAMTTPMSTDKPSEGGLMKGGAKEYFDGAMHQAGEQTVTYEAANGQQQLDDAKAQAQGLWAKYCGCFASMS